MTSEPGPDDELDGEGFPLPIPGYCNAKIWEKPGKRESKTRCGQPEGWGTDYSRGPCKNHGGRHANGRKHAALATYAEVYANDTLFGQTVDLDPMVGLLEVGGKLAGFTAFIEREIQRQAAETGRVRLKQTATTAGGGSREVPDVLIEMWHANLERQAKVHKMALDAGAQQKQIDLFDAYRNRVLDTLEAALRAVGVDPDDPEVAAKIGATLMLVAGGAGGAA